MREVFEAMGEGKKILAIGAGHKIPEMLEMYPTMITLTHPQVNPWYKWKKRGKCGGMWVREFGAMKISPAHLISSTFKINYSNTGPGIYQMYLDATQDPGSLYPKQGQEMGFRVGSQETCPPTLV